MIYCTILLITLTLLLKMYAVIRFLLASECNTENENYKKAIKELNSIGFMKKN